MPLNFKKFTYQNIVQYRKDRWKGIRFNIFESHNSNEPTDRKHRLEENCKPKNNI